MDLYFAVEYSSYILFFKCSYLKKDKIDIYAFRNHTKDEEQKIEKIKEKISKYRGYIEADLYRLDKCIQTVNNINDKTIAKCRKRIRMNNSLEAIAGTVGTVFKKAIIPAVSKGASLAKEGYYKGMDELGEKVDEAYKNFYKEMKSKPTSTLLNYYNNRELNNHQFSVIEEILEERGAL